MKLTTLFTTCAALAALASPAAAATVEFDWTAWLNRDGPWGGNENEKRWNHWEQGNLDCEWPVAFEGRRRSDHVAAEATGETFRILGLEGLRCDNVDQGDGSCDNYEVRFGCATGVIDVGGAYELQFDPADVVFIDEAAYVDGPVDVVFAGGHSFAFDDAMLELEQDGATVDWVGGVVSGGFTSDIGPLSLFGMVLSAGGIDITIGYGGAALVNTLETPLDPSAAGTYFFLSAQTGSDMHLADGITLSSESGEATLVVDPTAPTVYGYLEFPDIFPPAWPVTPSHIGFGISAQDDVFDWTPAADPYGSMPDAQLGNLWVTGGVDVGLNDLLTLNFSGEGMARVDWDEFGTDDALEVLAINGSSAIELGLPHIGSLTLDLANASFYADNSVVAVAGEAGLAALLGVSGLPGSLTAQVTILPQAQSYVVVMDGDMNLPLVDVEVHLQGYDGLIAGGAELDFGLTEVSAVAQAVDGSLRITTTVDGSFPALAGHVEYEVDVAVEGDDVDFAGRLRYCALGLCLPWGSTDVDLTSGGALKVCYKGVCSA